MKNFELVEMNKLETEISELKKVKEEQDNEKISLNRRIDFLEVEIK